MAVFSGAGFIKHFAQAIDIRLRCAGTLRRDETFRAHKGTRLIDLGHQADVGQFGNAVHEDDVGRFDVPMHQPGPVQFGQGLTQGQAQFQTFRRAEPAVKGNLPAQRLGKVSVRIDSLTRLLVVAQLHHIIEVSFWLVHPHVQHVHKALVRAGDRFKSANARPFPLEGPVVREGLAIDDLDGAIHAQGVARQPHGAVAAAADAAQQLVVRDGRRRSDLGLALIGGVWFHSRASSGFVPGDHG